MMYKKSKKSYLSPLVFMVTWALHFNREVGDDIIREVGSINKDFKK